MFKNWTKEKWFSLICNNFLVLAGSFLLAIGAGVFLINLNIVAGGLSGIGIIIQHFIDFQIIDIFVWVMTAILWVIGWFFVGKEFSLRTLVSSIAYPAFLSLILRVEYFQNITAQITGNGETSNVLICGLFGGVFIGSGVALTFLGKGSTGGVDVIIFILAKYTKLKESIWSFLLDATVIILSMIIIPNQWINSLVGILSAFVSAMMIEFIYNSNISSFQADIISDKWEEISRYAQDELGRGATIIRGEGGYQGNERVILRIVFEKRQFDKLRKYIASVDPKAFVTYTQTKAVYGEGFKDHK